MLTATRENDITSRDRLRSSGNPPMRRPVTCALELTRAPKSAEFDQVPEVSPGRGRWCAGDDHILAGGKAADNAVDSDAHQA